MIRSLIFNSSSLLAIAANCLLIAGYVLGDLALTSSVSIAETIAQANLTTNNCSQLTNRRYVTIINRSANLLPQLPRYLVLAAIPCNYLNGSMTFFGGFDNVKTSAFRANQLREKGLDAVVYSFNTKVSDIPSNLQAAAVLVELNNAPNVVIQQVQSITGKTAVLATFNNRSVIVNAPLSSIPAANEIASLLRNRGYAAQVISADIITSPTAAPINDTSTLSLPISTSTALNNNLSSTRTVYRVLVPNINANTLQQIRASAPDAFVTIFRGQSYIQVSTYTNRDNAHRERDRLNAIYQGTILLRD
ncbi:MAG: hypothetical protein ACK6BN_06145 [Pseudanabaena sp.]|jgi:hypothetical protein|nr:hypothetical protein [Pseudanabaena sp. M051S1SP2A07QC]MCA6584486.1 hypothetical protein [Pseudanabaena sp. M34BS1SP1A06MG]MCA6588486.1 hypothetical protein [Pseudanabaena sp. M109S1SP1A06QC]MCA6601371.1 hypothetical protein [Pseudanabaena sp. M57BS1SP1A06MG]MCA6604842.1 hypothetical protein [Pseudanabaena sp. M007S1SP1A06QC]MCA6615334.1 hypothetical protein [Pseudanabaena sp. M090S1SP1A06QC]MCA6623765.1 hypothetical protein [Pseudanabaena sp. M165S2SP1A06QC]MCE2976550.1 hypothetical prot